MKTAQTHSFAYLFERFPSFTQTFCAREVAEMFRQQMAPAVFSIRQPEDEADFPAGLKKAVRYLPPGDALTAEMKELREARKLPRPVLRALGRWGDAGDKTRIYEAAWLGPILRAEGIRHVHAHFAGIAARTAYWLKQFFGITYSFTGHANDIFCETTFPVSIADLVREARFVVTETNFSRDWLREKYPREARKIHRVYNGISVEGFPQADPASAPPAIVSVGRFVEKKGFADLIEACAILRERGIAFTCQLVGGGPLESDLRERIERRDLPGLVELAGPMPQPEVREMMSRARLFALACVTERDGGMDNLPTVIMEAMACALPVISTRVAGVPEMVREGESGFLAREKTPMEFADALARLTQDAALAAQMGARGRERVRECFSIENTARALKHLLAGERSVIVPPAAFDQDAEMIGSRGLRLRLPFSKRRPSGN